MARFDLSGKVALVAGASRGIGAAIAVGLAKHGAHVVCASRSLEDCETVAEGIRKAGGSASAAELHLANLAQHNEVISAIAREHGQLDILINNGATNVFYGLSAEMPEAAFDKTFDVNVKGPYFLSGRAIGLMVKNGGGTIVNIASIDAEKPARMRVAYGMTKAALVNMTRGMAKEYGQQGVRVNALLPGFTDTRLAAALKEDAATQEMIKTQLAIPRMAQPDEMVGAVVFMVSDEASYLTGQSIVVDGGTII